jgi:hypothetical protein
MALRLFVATLLIYLGTAKGILEEVDDVAMLRVTQSLVHGSMAVPADTPGVNRGIDGGYYARYGIGLSLLGIPLFVLGSVLPQDVPTREVYDPHGFVLATPLAFAMTGVGALSTAASVALLYRTVRALRYSTLASSVAAISLGLGTFAWFYARTFMTEPPSMLFLLLAVYGLLRFSQDRSRIGWLLASGAAAGTLMLLRIGNSVLLPPLGLWLLWTSHARLRSTGLSGCPRNAIAPVLIWSAPIAVALAVVASYNIARFGSPLATGYDETSAAFNTPVLVGLMGQLLSPGKSVFLYAPIVLAGVLGWFTLRRDHAPLAWTVAGLAGMYVLLYARYDWWYGGGPWAPRFLTVILPLGAFGLAALISRPLPRPALLCLGLLAIISVALQLPSILVPYLPYDAIMEQDPVTFDRMLWRPTYSPLVVATRDLVGGAYPVDLAFTYYAVDWLGPLQVGLTVAGLLTLVWCFRVTWRR